MYKLHQATSTTTTPALPKSGSVVTFAEDHINNNSNNNIATVATTTTFSHHQQHLPLRMPQKVASGNPQQQQPLSTNLHQNTTPPSTPHLQDSSANTTLTPITSSTRNLSPRRIMSAPQTTLKQLGQLTLDHSSSSSSPGNNNNGNFINLDQYREAEVEEIGNDNEDYFHTSAIQARFAKWKESNSTTNNEHHSTHATTQFKNNLDALWDEDFDMDKEEGGSNGGELVIPSTFLNTQKSLAIKLDGENITKFALHIEGEK